MEVLNDHYGDSAMVLPHRQYGLISGEFRTKNHWKFLGNDHEVWNPDTVLAEAKFVHFSDWPLPKPWTMWSPEQLATLQPACDKNPGTPEESGCRDREVWKQLYDDFRRKRKVRFYIEVVLVVPVLICFAGCMQVAELSSSDMIFSTLSRAI